METKEEAPVCSVFFASLGRVIVTLRAAKAYRLIALDLGVVTIAAWEEIVRDKTTRIKVVHGSNIGYTCDYDIACSFEDFTTFYRRVLDGIAEMQRQQQRTNQLLKPQ